MHVAIFQFRVGGSSIHELANKPVTSSSLQARVHMNPFLNYMSRMSNCGYKLLCVLRINMPTPWG